MFSTLGIPVRQETQIPMVTSLVSKAGADILQQLEAAATDRML